jgi:hypothetical protein
VNELLIGSATVSTGGHLIARIWHGYTKPEYADAYEAMLKPELLPGISKVKGYLGSYLLLRSARKGRRVTCATLCVERQGGVSDNYVSQMPASQQTGSDESERRVTRNALPVLWHASEI